MKKYDFCKLPKDFQARTAAMDPELMHAVAINTSRFVRDHGPEMKMTDLCTLFTMGFLWGQEHPLPRPKKKKVPTES